MNKFKIIPAIDLKNGKCVRLYQGDYNKETIYFDNPVDVAKKWQDQGAELIHIVDLDGAKDGSLVNFDIVKEITELGIKIEFGGGIRTIEDVEKLKNIGVEYCIIGTKAVEDEGFILEANEILNNKLVIGIDAKDGEVLTKGWLEFSSVNAVDLSKKVEELGIKRIIYTDIKTDGAFKGPNLKHVKNIIDKTEKILLTVSGGVSDYSDIEDTKNLCEENNRIFGLIIGKALYENKIDLKTAIAKA
jgi:phosphoribosylformimino-5-aminoimidazole carboxamide ribotide isomerase